MSNEQRLDRDEPATSEDIRLGFWLFLFTLAIGGAMTAIVLAKIT